MAAAATAYDVALRLNPGDLAALHFLAAYPAAGLTDKAKAQQRIFRNPALSLPQPERRV